MKFLFYTILITFATLGNIFLKKGINSLGKLDINFENFLSALGKILSNFQVIGGLGFYALAAVLYFVLLSKTNLNIAASLMTFLYVSVILVSVFYFKETIPILSWIGIGFICLGIYLVSRNIL